MRWLNFPRNFFIHRVALEMECSLAAICVTESDCLDLDQNFSRAYTGKINFIDGQWRSGFLGNRSRRFHQNFLG